jgi:glycosyltransferase involved in cell wall biosynthesis
MNSKIKISIIIAIYNSEKTLEKCLNSIFNQTFQNYELIIVDNNSIDNSYLILNKYKNRIQYYIKEKDSGIYDAWNKGVKLSNAEWICFLGSDDYLLPDALNILISELINHPTANFISGKIKLLNKNKDIVVGEPFSQKKIKYYQNFVHIASLTSIKLFENCQFDYRYKIAGDYDFYVRNRRKIIPIFTNTILAFSELGISQKSTKVFLENLNIWKKNRLHSNIFSYFLFFYQSLLFRLKNLFNN